MSTKYPACPASRACIIHGMIAALLPADERICCSADSPCTNPSPMPNAESTSRRCALHCTLAFPMPHCTRHCGATPSHFTLRTPAPICRRGGYTRTGEARPRRATPRHCSPRQAMPAHLHAATRMPPHSTAQAHPLMSTRSRLMQGWSLGKKANPGQMPRRALPAPPALALPAPPPPRACLPARALA